MSERTLVDALADLASWGCTNHGCAFRGNEGGMHTNSSCKCLSEIRNPSVRVRLIEILRLARAAPPVAAGEPGP